MAYSIFDTLRGEGDGFDGNLERSDGVINRPKGNIGFQRFSHEINPAGSRLKQISLLQKYVLLLMHRM